MVAAGGLTADRITASKQIKATLGMVAAGGVQPTELQSANLSIIRNGC